jgi:hypothetical protein
MWFADALFLPFGIFLMVKAKNDSALFSAENYMKYLKTIERALSIFGVKSNIKAEDDENYYKPSIINSSAATRQTLLEMFDEFKNNINVFLEKIKSEEYDINDIKDFNKRYDNMLSVLWGFDDDNLKEKLKKYPQAADLSILKSETVTPQMLQPLLLKKLEQIIKTNIEVEKQFRIDNKYDDNK